MKYICVVALYILPIFGTCGLRAQGLHIANGAHWITNGSPVLVLNNAGFTNNGAFDAGLGTVLFTGDTATSATFIAGDGAISFYHLIVDKSANDLQLNANSLVTGTIVLQHGNLQLNNRTLDLGQTGMIVGERNGSCIMGAQGGLITATAILNAASSVNPGNIGVEISSDADMGRTVITRGHVPQLGLSGHTSIGRYFDINSEMNTGLGATLRFFYLDSELDGKNKAALDVFSNPQGGGAWAFLGKEGADSVNDWVVKNNIGELHRFTLGIPYSVRADPSGKIPTSLHVYPNPSSGAFRTVLVSEAENTQVLHLFDQKGRLIASKSTHCLAGANSLEWNVNDLAAGIYYITAEGLPAASLIIVH
jgi:hypothetical protein